MIQFRLYTLKYSFDIQVYTTILPGPVILQGRRKRNPDFCQHWRRIRLFYSGVKKHLLYDNFFDISLKRGCFYTPFLRSQGLLPLLKQVAEPSYMARDHLDVCFDHLRAVEILDNTSRVELFKLWYNYIIKYDHL